MINRIGQVELTGSIDESDKSSVKVFESFSEINDILFYLTGHRCCRILNQMDPLFCLYLFYNSALKKKCQLKRRVFRIFIWSLEFFPTLLFFFSFLTLIFLHFYVIMKNMMGKNLVLSSQGKILEFDFSGSEYSGKFLCNGVISALRQEKIFGLRNLVHGLFRSFQIVGVRKLTFILFILARYFFIFSHAKAIERLGRYSVHRDSKFVRVKFFELLGGQSFLLGLSSSDGEHFEVELVQHARIPEIHKYRWEKALEIVSTLSKRTSVQMLVLGQTDLPLSDFQYRRYCRLLPFRAVVEDQTQVVFLCCGLYTSTSFILGLRAWILSTGNLAVRLVLHPKHPLYCEDRSETWPESVATSHIFVVVDSSLDAELVDAGFPNVFALVSDSYWNEGADYSGRTFVRLDEIELNLRDVS